MASQVDFDALSDVAKQLEGKGSQVLGREGGLYRLGAGACALPRDSRLARFRMAEVTVLSLAY